MAPKRTLTLIIPFILIPDWSQTNAPLDDQPCDASVDWCGWKMSVGGKESNTKSLTGKITMIVSLRILRMKKVGSTHPQILIGHRSIR